MIHTDEEDEFERIERENKMKGQPYHWEADAIKAAVLIEREECARIAENWNSNGFPRVGVAAQIRARGNVATNDTSAERVDITEKHKHDN
jgi:hypothetical protein